VFTGKDPVCTSCRFVFYQNSKPCVGIFIFDRGKVLLTKRAHPPYQGQYDVVGGFLENGELPEIGLHREALEELGVKIKIIDLLGFYINDYGSRHLKTLDIFYIGKITAGNPIAHDDVAKLEWHPITQLPPTEMISVSLALKDLPVWYSKHQNLLK